MFVMVAGRRQGKSVTALRWLLEQPGDRILLVANKDRQEHLHRTLARMVGGQISREFVEARIIVVDRFVGRGGSSAFRYAREVGIDDAEEVLRILFGAPVEFVTMNATLIPTATTSVVDGDFVERKGLEGRGVLQEGEHLTSPDRIAGRYA